MQAASAQKKCHGVATGGTETPPSSRHNTLQEYSMSQHTDPQDYILARLFVFASSRNNQGNIKRIAP